MASNETNDQTFMMTFTAVLAVLLVLTVGVFVLASIYSSENDDKVSDVERNRIAQAIQPYGQVAVGSPPPEPVAAVARAPYTAAQVIEDNCSSCHASGSLGAPKIGDKAAWSARLANGAATLLKNAIIGKGENMPPKGGDDDLSDAEVKAALVLMLKQSGGLELK